MGLEFVVRNQVNIAGQKQMLGYGKTLYLSTVVVL